MLISWGALIWLLINIYWECLPPEPLGLWWTHWLCFVENCTTSRIFPLFGIFLHGPSGCHPGGLSSCGWLHAPGTLIVNFMYNALLLTEVNIAYAKLMRPTTLIHTSEGFLVVLIRFTILRPEDVLCRWISTTSFHNKASYNFGASSWFGIFLQVANRQSGKLWFKEIIAAGSQLVRRYELLSLVAHIPLTPSTTTGVYWESSTVPSVW